MTTPRHYISAIVPVFNSEDTLRELVERLGAVLGEHAAEFEILLIDDGSRDASWSVIQELARGHGRVRGLNMMRNFGQHNALLAGVRAARGDVIVTLDDDLQNPPEEIPKLLAELDAGHDLVYGAPDTERHGLWRDRASIMLKWLLARVMGVRNSQILSAFRVFRTDLRQAFGDFHGSHVVLDVLLAWGTEKIAGVRVRHAERQAGRSNYTFGKLVRHAVNLYTGFSILPLQVASGVGFGTFVFGLLVLVYVLGRYLIQGGSVPGFPFLASTVAILGGAQLFALGIIGEYLGRMYLRSLGKPCYTIRAETDARDGRV